MPILSLDPLFQVTILGEVEQTEHISSILHIPDQPFDNFLENGKLFNWNACASAHAGINTSLLDSMILNN